MKVIALDLEGTLISNAISQMARPGLHDFLEACRNLCSRVVIFTTVKEDLFYQIATILVNEGSAPGWFKEIEYVHWSGEKKDLGFVKNVDPVDVVLVDDFEGYVCIHQKSQWIEVENFCHPYSDADTALKSVLKKLELYVLALTLQPQAN